MPQIVLAFAEGREGGPAAAQVTCGRGFRGESEEEMSFHLRVDRGEGWGRLGGPRGNWQRIVLP